MLVAIKNTIFLTVIANKLSLKLVYDVVIVL